MSGNGENGKWKAPRHLKAATRRWAQEIADSYVLESHHHRLLIAAAECLDRMASAREIVDREGMTIDGRFGKKIHPAVMIEKDNKVVFARLIRELNLDDSPEAPRPPGLRYGG
jgi:phage terminase small subunit